LLPQIGNRPVAELLPLDILNAARAKPEKQSKKGDGVQTMHRLVQLAGQILQFAFIEGRVPINVGKGITGALPAMRVTNYPAITEPKEVGRLLRHIDGYKGHSSIRYFLKVLPYVFCRPSELRLTEWREINFGDAVFTIPWPRMKTRRKSQKDHHVPLSRQVITLLKELQEFSGSGRFLFPSIRAKTDTISDAGPLAALRDMGYDQNTHCLHGFRSTASTLLNEKVGFRSDVIEYQLDHGDPSAVRAIYNRATYWQDRVEMMQKWADYLDGLRAQIT